MTVCCSRFTLKRTSYTAIPLVLLLLLHSQFSLLSLMRWEEASFFFEKATPELIAEGHPKATLLRTDVANLREVFVTRYVKWHSSQIAAIKSPSLDQRGIRTMVFVGSGPRHGLGDRFRCILYAYVCAVFSDRVLLLTWDQPYPLSTIFVNGLGTNFTYDPVHFAPRRRSNGSPDEIRIRRATTLHDLPMFLLSVGTVWLECEPPARWSQIFAIRRKDPDLETSRELSKILPLKVRPSPPEIFPLFLQALFKPSPQLRNLMSDLLADHNRFSILRLWKRGRKISSTHPYVSVHARVGHGVGELTGRFDIEKMGLRMNAVADCMAHHALALAQEVGITDPPRFYLATDTVKFRRLFRRALLRRDTRTKMMSGTWGVKHVKHLRSNSAGDVKQYLYTMLDIYLLSKGKGALCSRSGFCRLAVWMGGNRSTAFFREEICTDWMKAS